MWSRLEERECSYLLAGTHPGDGADVVGDGDEGGLGQVLPTHLRLPLLRNHVTKAEIIHCRASKSLRSVNFVDCSLL